MPSTRCSLSRCYHSRMAKPRLSALAPVVKFTVSLPPEHASALAAAAESRGMTRSGLIRRLVERSGLLPSEES